MNEIKTIELKKELKYNNTVILTYKIQYPKIVSSNCKFGIDTFNKFNENKAIELEKYVNTTLFKEAKEVYDYNKLHGYPIMVFEVILEYNITYNKDCIISLYYDQYEFTGGAHGNTIRTSQNWDLQSGCQIPLSYFYPNNPYYIIDILKNINNQIKEQIQSGTNQYFDNYCELVLETFNLESYYLTPNAIAIYFQQYDIAPYSSGIPVFYLMYE